MRVKGNSGIRARVAVFLVGIVVVGMLSAGPVASQTSPQRRPGNGFQQRQTVTATTQPGVGHAGTTTASSTATSSATQSSSAQVPTSPAPTPPGFARAGSGGGSEVVVIPLASAFRQGGAAVAPRPVALDDKGDRFEGRAGDTDVIAVAKRADADNVVSIGRPGRRLDVGELRASGWPTAREARGAAERNRSFTNRVLFPDAFAPNVDVEYEAFTDGVKESIVMAAPPRSGRQVEFRFVVRPQGLEARQTKDGGIEFVAESGAVAITVPPSFAFDSRGGRNTPGNAHTRVPMDVSGTAERGYVITVRPSTAWLTAPARVYPVTVDPTFLLRPWNPMNLAYMPWGDNSDGVSFSSWTYLMQFGNWWGSNWISYLQFDPSELVARDITSVKLRLPVQHCDNQLDRAKSYQEPIHVRRLTSPYFYGQSWERRPRSDGDVTVRPTGATTSVVADITSLAMPWIADGSKNLGLQLDMATAPAYCRVPVYSGFGEPVLEVTYSAFPEYGLAKNFSFENGREGWATCDGSYWAEWEIEATDTPSGRRASTLRSPYGGGVGVCQAVPIVVRPDERYTLVVSVRSKTGSPVSGRVFLREAFLGSQLPSIDEPFTVNGAWWQNLTFTFDGPMLRSTWMTLGLSTVSMLPIQFDYMALTVSKIPPPTTLAAVPASVSNAATAAH